jgi:signal transduction histidine kinase
MNIKALAGKSIEKLRGKSDFYPVAAVVICGITIAIATFLLVRGYYYTAEQNQFRSASAEFSAKFRSVMARHVASLEAIRAFVTASHAVSRWEFSNFSNQVLPQNEGFKAVLWLPNISDLERPAFEAAMQRDGLYGLRLREMQRDATLSAAGKKHRYIPVAYVEPFEASGSLIGVDLSNDPIYQPIFQRAELSGKAVASAPLDHALLEAVDGPLLLVAYPLKRDPKLSKGSGGETLQGYALGILQLSKVIESTLGNHSSLQAAIAYGGGEPKVFEKGSGRKASISEWYGASEYHLRSPFTVGGQQLFLVMRSPLHGNMLTRVYVPAGAGLLILALTALLTQSMMTTLLRKRMVERAVIEATAELRSTNRELEQEVKQRRIAEAALTVARDKAEGANRAKSAFLSTMSHELRTPLNSVIGFSQLLMESSSLPAPKVHDYLGEINGSGKVLLDLINDILELTGMESEISDAGELVYVTDIINYALDKLSLQARKKGVTLVSQIDPDLPPLRGDGRRLQKALYNLVANAIKFTNAGGSAKIEAYGVEDGLVLEVVDSGVGIEPGTEARIVELFNQADNSLSRHHEGIGLGLTFAHRVAVLHHATLRLSSTPSGGTCVRFHFPSKYGAELREVA